MTAQPAPQTVPASPVPEVDSDDYSSFGALMVELLTGKLSVPVWIRSGSTTTLITAERKDAVCQGLLLALDMHMRAKGIE